MNKQILLKRVQALGFKGKAALEDVRSFLDGQGFDTKTIDLGDGKTDSLDSIWSKTVHLMCDGGEQVEMHDPPGGEEQPGGETPPPQPPQKAAVVPEVKSAPRLNYRPGVGWREGIGQVDAKGAGMRDKRSVAKKSYDLKAKHGGTVYADADQAEVAGAWFRSVCGKARGYNNLDSDLEILGKANVESINTDGGVLVPDEFMANLLWLTEKYGVARKLANVVPMSRDYLIAPRKTGIVTMSPIGEGATITDTSNTFDGVALTAKKWGALVKISNELLEDSAVNVADDYSQTFAEAQAVAEDSAWILGDGSSTYNGCTGLASGFPSGAYISATGSGWSAMLLSDFFISAIGAVEYVNTSRLAFLCSRQFFAQVMLKLSNIGGSAGYLGGGNTMIDAARGMKIGPGAGSSGPDAMFQGFPVYFSQVMPTATAGSEQKACYFGDFAGASMLGDRRQLGIATSDQRYFDSDYFAIRAISRFTVNAHGAGRGETYGPVVCLTST